MKLRRVVVPIGDGGFAAVILPPSRWPSRWQRWRMRRDMPRLKQAQARYAKQVWNEDEHEPVDPIEIIRACNRAPAAGAGGRG